MYPASRSARYFFSFIAEEAAHPNMGATKAGLIKSNVIVRVRPTATEGGHADGEAVDSWSRAAGGSATS